MEKYLKSLDVDYVIIKDIGGGINYTKKALQVQSEKAHAGRSPSLDMG